MNTTRRWPVWSLSVLALTFAVTASALTLTRKVNSAEALPIIANAALTKAGAQTGCGTTPLPDLLSVSSQNGLLDATLELKLAKNQLAGRTIETNSYNGKIPGALWRVKPGDTLRVKFINNSSMPGMPPPTPSAQCLACSVSGAPDRLHGAHDMKSPEGAPAMSPAAMLASNLHTHGLQVTPICPGDDPYLLIKPGECFNYTIPIPKEHPKGFYWYHPHNHGTTSKQSWGGMAGAILVEDNPNLPLAANDKVMILQEIWVDNQGHVPGGMVIPVAGPVNDPDRVQFSTIPAVPSNVYFTVNGAYQPVINIRAGEVQRWRFLNAAPHRFFKLQYKDANGNPVKMYQAAQDGLPFPTFREVTELPLAPGNRAEVYIVGTSAGCGKLLALAHDQGHPGGPLPEALMASVSSAGSGTTGKPAEVAAAQYTPPFAPTPPPVSQMTKRTIEFSGTVLPAPVQFFLNQKIFDPNRIDQTVTVGRWEEWTLVNKDVFQHPFHIHVNPFQVISVNGQPWTGPLWWDTFALPSRSTVKVLMWFRPDVVGKTVYHCHILPHEDNGMMSAFVLQK